MKRPAHREILLQLRLDFREPLTQEPVPVRGGLEHLRHQHVRELEGFLAQGRAHLGAVDDEHAERHVAVALLQNSGRNLEGKMV
jgi:hypothetical protein